MTTWNIYRIVDHNECPPVTTFYDSSRSGHDCLKDLRDQGKDLALIDIDIIPVQRSKKDVVSLLNCVGASAQFGGREEPVEKKRTHRHLRVVK